MYALTLKNYYSVGAKIQVGKAWGAMAQTPDCTSSICIPLGMPYSASPLPPTVLAALRCCAYHCSTLHILLALCQPATPDGRTWVRYFGRSNSWFMTSEMCVRECLCLCFYAQAYMHVCMRVCIDACVLDIFEKVHMCWSYGCDSRLGVRLISL